MGKVKEKQIDAEFNRDLAQNWATKKAQRKQEAISEAREALKYRGFQVVEFNNSLHFRVEGTYDFYPTTGKFKHMKWVNVSGHGLEELIEMLENNKTNKVVYSFCPSCKSRFPHRENEKFSHCNRCINKNNAAEAERRRARKEAERIAARDEPEKIDFIADWDTPCSTCNQTPSIKGFDMCATCTFGEAEAQQDLIEGKL